VKWANCCTGSLLCGLKARKAANRGFGDVNIQPIGDGRGWPLATEIQRRDGAEGMSAHAQPVEVDPRRERIAGRLPTAEFGYDELDVGDACQELRQIRAALQSGHALAGRPVLPDGSVAARMLDVDHGKAVTGPLLAPFGAAAARAAQAVREHDGGPPAAGNLTRSGRSRCRAASVQVASISRTANGPGAP
jgi:hypothetical protein